VGKVTETAMLHKNVRLLMANKVQDELCVMRLQMLKLPALGPE
jgi:hypothetical protein